MSPVQEDEQTTTESGSPLTSRQDLLDEFLPGALCPIDATNSRIELTDDEGEDGLTRADKENCLKNLVKEADQRDLTSRRLDIRDAWKARYFYRGNQYLLQGKNGAWIMPHQVLLGGQSFDDHNDETNIYLAFADTINAALSAGTPSVRFEADDPSDPADISASDSSNNARKLIERANDMPAVQEDINRFLWTDGRAFVYTRYVIDGQRFGYGNESDQEDELSYLPETGGLSPAGDETELGPESGEPRGQEVLDAFGAIEVKTPMQARSLDECDYLRLAREFDITRMKTKYPHKADDIEPMQTSTAESEYERLARTSIMMGTRPSNMTNDTMTYQASEELCWVRPSFFQVEKDLRKLAWLFDNFPKGCMVAMVGKAVCEARNESLADHWTMIKARPGDGSHVPALGSPLIPIQEKLNDCVDLTHDSFMNLIPITWVDSEAVDTQALNEIQAKPKQYLKIKRKADKDIASNFYTEQQIEIAVGLIQYMQWLFGEGAQFLCGAFPALFGGDTGANDTAKGIASQRDQALGRLGLTWRSIRAGYANIMRQAVQCAAEFRNSPMAGEVPGAGGVKQQLRVDPDDLKGNVRCFPDTDENFPESWVAQRMVWTQFIQAAATNPVIAQILQVPRNMLIAKDKTGLPELIVPAAAATAKQAGETMILLSDGAPLPNPAIQEAQQKMAQLPPDTPPEAQQAIQQALKNTPPEVSTVKINPRDPHSIHIAEIDTWIQSPEGIRAEKENPDGFRNVMVHQSEHEAALAKQQSQNQKPQEKPISKSLSLNVKDIPTPEGQAQAIADFGITVTPQSIQAEDAKEQAAAAPAITPVVQ